MEGKEHAIKKCMYDFTVKQAVPVWTLPFCVDGLLLPQPHLGCAGRVYAVGQCVCLFCAAPRRSGHTPAKLQWREHRRKLQMSTPRRLGQQSCKWYLHGHLMERWKRGECKELLPYKNLDRPYKMYFSSSRRGSKPSSARQLHTSILSGGPQVVINFKHW